MAYTKVFAIRVRLDDRVAYVTNSEKTGLDASLRYAVNPEKTEQTFFTSALNCATPETAFSEMQATKDKWGKPGGVLGYHFIQSFAPGEVTPEEAHAIGVEFAKRCFGEHFEVVIGTHLDRHHLHNHVVVNSVSWTDGLKYHSSPKSYFQGIRGTSDELCREHGLSVIETSEGGKHYAEWKAEQDGKPTLRGQLRAELDDILRQSLNYSTFLDLLRRRGYVVNTRRKHTTIRPPWRDYTVRLDSLGSGYTEADIKTRLQNAKWDFPKRTPPMRTIQTYRYRGKFHERKKLHGFRALYFRYLYLLGKVKRRKAPPAARRALTADLIQFDRYVTQHKFLAEHRIDTTAQLTMYQEAVTAKMEALVDRRRGLYASRKEMSHEQESEAISVEISTINTELRTLRREISLCRRIETDAAQVQEHMRQAQAPKPKSAVKRTRPVKKTERKLS